MGWIQNGLRSALGLDRLNDLVMYVNHQLNGTAEYNDLSTDAYKLKAIFSNPALLKVICLQCDLFSLGQVYVYRNGKEIKDDPFLEMIKNPNPFQKQSQFLWDIMFWNMLGNCYNYCDSKIVSPDNSLYILQNDKITFPSEMIRMKDKIVLSNKTYNEIDKLQISYKYDDGTRVKLPWSNIIHIADLSNGTGNWFRGQSRIDALHKVISNSEAAFDALNINIKYSGKFMVAGKADPENPSQLIMPEAEKLSIEQKINSNKSVHAVKSMIDIKRFVENMASLKLDETQLNAYFLIGSIYNIPKDVLEVFASGTYENQEKARGAFVTYCLEPKGKLFFENHSQFFGYEEQGKSIVIDWEHLPFMQVFAKDRADVNKVKSETIINLMKAGVKLQDINKILDLTLTELDYERLTRAEVSTAQRN